MFDNAGTKIQKISKILAGIGITVGIIVGLLGMGLFMEGLDSYYGQDDVTMGIMSMIGGSILALTSYLSSLFLCAFSKLTEDISEIKSKMINEC